jgi:hypothetical protein
MSASTTPENKEVLKKAKAWFKSNIIEGHIERTTALKNAEKFQINPFITPYLSAFLTGQVTVEGVAKSLVYARILGTSISTSFGQNLQNFISEVLVDAYGSIVPGIDIKFTDKIDGREKYAQLKLGPNTINADDVTTIHNHFRDIRNLARTNRFKLGTTDLIVGVLYGTDDDLSSHYKRLRDQHSYPIFVGSDFWHRLTGDKAFFGKLIQSISETLSEVNSSAIIDTTIRKLSQSSEIQSLVALANAKK